MNVNRVFLAGNLTRDVELRHTPNNTAVAKFGLAVNRKFKVGEEQREEVAFIDCEAWGRTAEVIAQYFSKGKTIFVEGRLKLDQWDDKATGQKRSKLFVVVESFQFAGGKGDGESSASARPTTAARQTVVETSQHDADIPF